MSQQTVSRDKVITLTYSITDELGDTVEQIDIPIHYLHGGNSGLFEKVEAALEGHCVGDRVSVELSPEEGFGSWDPTLSFSDAIENVPPQYRTLGAKADFESSEGETVTMVVTHVDNGTVTLDGNHPFAGKTITFHINIDGIRAATPEEIRNGDVDDKLPPMLH